MIKIEGINKTFNAKKILSDVSGEFSQGKTNLIIGASGTGKSVLLKCIVGLIHPEEGKVFFNGRDFLEAKKEEQTEIRREIGMLFQGGALFDSKNVEDNVMFPLNILTTKKKKEKLERVNFCLEKVGLAQTNKLMPSELSGGMKKRVGIARAIVNTPKYLFCDEPNSGLDPQTAIRIDELIKEITYELDITTVVVTHDMNSVMEMGDKIIFIFEGQKLWEGNKSDITKSTVKELNNFVFANKMMTSPMAN